MIIKIITSVLYSISFVCSLYPLHKYILLSYTFFFFLIGFIFIPSGILFLEYPVKTLGRKQAKLNKYNKKKLKKVVPLNKKAKRIVTLVDSF